MNLGSDINHNAIKMERLEKTNRDLQIKVNGLELLRRSDRALIDSLEVELAEAHAELRALRTLHEAA